MSSGRDSHRIYFGRKLHANYTAQKRNRKRNRYFICVQYPLAEKYCCCTV